MTDESWRDLLGPRSIEDILGERVPIVVGDETIDLRVLTIRENREWKRKMDLQLGYFLSLLTIEDDGERILALFDGQERVWLELLIAYDVDHKLPSRAVLEDRLTPMALIRAVLEVWRAARPLADIARTGMTLTTPTSNVGWRERMSSWLRRTAGPPVESKPN